MFKKIEHILALVTFFTLAMPSKVNSQDLSSYKWKHRVLVVKTTSESNQDYSKQIAQFSQDVKGFKERKLVLIEVVDNRFRTLEFKDQITTSDWTAINRDLKQTLRQPKEFEVLLIGLDGGVKLRQQEVLTLLSLYEKIDTMPMRSRELLIKGNKN